ncbi:MAG: hypothetical protein QM704_00520 [Anaeromyxobacteraceae bacterium]
MFRELEREVLGEAPVVDLTQLPADAPAPAPARPTSRCPLRSKRKAAAAPDAHDLPVAPAVLDGMAPAAAYAWSWATLDEHLFQAIEHMTHQSVASLSDLHRAVTGWDSVTPGGDVSEALVNKVKGHLAEWLAADHLHTAGHAPAMPIDSNQAGWDLQIDGQPFNVKLVGDFSNLSEHFATNPDIPVIVPHDMAGLPDDAIHFDGAHPIDLVAAKEAGATVFVDDALSHADVTDAAQSGLEVGAGHVSLHVPWITMGISAFREGKLLLKGHTDLGRMVKNVAVDTAAVGGGGALGMKAGAAIGTFIAPGLGTAIGAGIGGIFGGLAGRKVANRVKRAPLENAKGEFEEAVASFEGRREETVAEADRRWKVGYDAQAARLLAERGEAEAMVTQAVAVAREAIGKVRTVTPEDGRKVLGKASIALRRELKDARAAVRAIPCWRRTLWPRPEDHEAAARLEVLEAFCAAWEAARREAEGGLEAPFATERVFDLAMHAQGGEQVSRAFLARLGRIRAQVVVGLERVRLAAVRRVAEARAAAVKVLEALKAELAAWIDAELKSPLRALKRARTDFVKELRAAGVEVDG